MSRPEYSNGFAVQTEMGINVGFLLGSPSFRVQSGDCVFMLMPEKPQALETYVGRELLAAKAAGEHQWENVAGSIDIKLDGQLRMSIAADGRIVLPGGSVIGKALPLPPRQ